MEFINPKKMSDTEKKESKSEEKQATPVKEEVKESPKSSQKKSEKATPKQSAKLPIGSTQELRNLETILSKIHIQK